MKKKVKLVAVALTTLALGITGLTGCVFQDGEGIWRSWGPNGDNQTYTGMDYNENGWWYFRDGVIDWGYTGFADNVWGTWLFQNGQIDFNYNGMYGDHLIEGGRLKREFEGVYNGYFFRGGIVDRGYSGYYNGYNIENGEVINGYDYYCKICGEKFYSRSFADWDNDSKKLEESQCTCNHFNENHGFNCHPLDYWQNRQLTEATYIDENGEHQIDVNKYRSLLIEQLTEWQPMSDNTEMRGYK